MAAKGTVTTIDRDTIAAIETFRSVGQYPSKSQALKSLVQRAQRFNLHRLNNEQFERLIDSVMQPQPTS